MERLLSSWSSRSLFALTISYGFCCTSVSFLIERLILNQKQGAGIELSFWKHKLASRWLQLLSRSCSVLLPPRGCRWGKKRWGIPNFVVNHTRAALPGVPQNPLAKKSGLSTCFDYSSGSHVLVTRPGKPSPDVPWLFRIGQHWAGSTSRISVLPQPKNPHFWVSNMTQVCSLCASIVLSPLLCFSLQGNLLLLHFMSLLAPYLSTVSNKL